MIRSYLVFMGLMLAAAMVSGCEMAEQQAAYRQQQRQDCMAAGGYFEENKVGSPDNYTCKGAHGTRPVIIAPAPPTNCHTQTTTIRNSDGTEVTKSSQVCSSF